MSEYSHLVRYGLMANVGRFHAETDMDQLALERGDLVVLMTHRGMELGEVLASQPGGEKSRRADDLRRADDSTNEKSRGLTAERIVRRASSDDVVQAKNLEARRVSCFEDCQRILNEFDWPGELIDVEPLLDGATIVLLVVAFDDFDEGVLRARFRVIRDVEILIEPIGGTQANRTPSAETLGAGSCGSCGSGNCSTGGGCSTGGCSTKARLVSGSKRSGNGARGASSRENAVEAKASGCATCALSRTRVGSSE